MTSEALSDSYPNATLRTRPPHVKGVIATLATPSERNIGLLLILVAAVAFVVVPIIDTRDPGAIGIPMQAPSAAHPFGTDDLGRDLFVRVFLGGRLDLVITVISVLVAASVGMFVGLVVATLPTLLRSLASRCIEAMLAIPYLVLVIGISSLFRYHAVIPGTPPGAAGTVIALAIGGWAPFANLTMSQVLTLRGRESVIAARVLGYSYPRILIRHIAPSALSANISFSATQAVWNIAGLAGLALLGVGVQAPTAELGVMVQEGTPLLPNAPWIALIPGGVIVILGVGFGLIADSFDARRRGS